MALSPVIRLHYTFLLILLYRLPIIYRAITVLSPSFFASPFFSFFRFRSFIIAHDTITFITLFLQALWGYTDKGGG